MALIKFRPSDIVLADTLDVEEIYTRGEVTKVIKTFRLTKNKAGNWCTKYGNEYSHCSSDLAKVLIKLNPEQYRIRMYC